MLFSLFTAMTFKPQEDLLPYPNSYVCYQATGPIQIDGKLDDGAWANAPWTDYFVDIEGSKKPAPRFKTRAKMLWDKDYLYIGAELEEPQIWATLHEHDSVIFHDNDFEVFIDPDNDGCFYTELELNALNTTWDLLLPRSYRGGGPAINQFELAGLKTATHVEGTLNDVHATNHHWSTEIAIPWKAFDAIANTSLPPKDGDQWRIDFSRVEWHVDVADGKYHKRPGREDNWVWSPIGVVDMHRPEQWGFLQFTDKSSGEVGIVPSEGFRERRVLIDAWEAQMQYHRDHGRWAASAAELGAKHGVEVSAAVESFELRYEGFGLDRSLRFFKLPSGR